MAIHYHLNGEPLLDPRLPQIIAQGRALNPRSTHYFSTNGSLLGKRANEFFSQPESLPDSITVSFDGGTKEAYETHRVGLVFEKTLESVKKFIETRDALGFDKPKVTPLMIITRDNERTVEEFKRLWKGVLVEGLDSIYFGPLMNWAGEVEVSRPTRQEFRRSTPCPYLHRWVFIIHTGEAVMCCMDYEGREIVGDARTQTVHEIYMSARYQELRELYSQERWDELPLCKNCSLRSG